MNRIYAGVLASLAVILGTSCKPAENASTSSTGPLIRPSSNPKLQPTPAAQPKLLNKARTGLTATQWLTKQNISAAEARTVDALLESIPLDGGPSDSPAAMARWADRRLRVVDLNGKKLSNISPILVFKNISTLHMGGNKLTQSQVDELITGLPNLKTLVIDPGLNCDANSKVTCIY